MAKKLLIHNLSEPLGSATSAMIEISAGTGNLVIDSLTGGEQLLASGTLEYMEKQDPPTPTISRNNGQASLSLRASGGRRSAFRMPWAACNGETEWRIHLNPAVSSDITAHSGGGNVKLNLSGMVITRLSADTGGGNMELVLPDKAVSLAVAARTGAGNVSVEIGSATAGSNIVNATSGAGNVTVLVPEGIAACIHATSGMGKAIIDPRFSQIDSNTYQSPDYGTALDKVEINMNSGAGNVSVNLK